MSNKVSEKHDFNGALVFPTSYRYTYKQRFPILIYPLSYLIGDFVGTYINCYQKMDVSSIGAGGHIGII